MFSLLYSICSNRAVGQSRLSILIYHRVLEQRDPLRGDIVTAEEFDEQMAWASKYFNVLPMRDAVELMAKGKLPRRALAITFDDGYRDNLTIAVPILKKYALPASFYIACNYLNENPKWDYLTEAIRSTKLKVVRLDKKEYSLANLEDKVFFSEEAPRVIKAYSEEQGDAMLEALIDELGRIEVNDLMLNVEELKQLAASGMEIGGHGNKHYILANVSDAEAKQEIVGGKQILEEIIGQKLAGLAYPNGLYPVDFNESHMELAKAAGYQYALATNIGTSAGTDELYQLRRYTPWRRNKLGFLAELAVNYWR